MRFPHRISISGDNGIATPLFASRVFGQGGDGCCTLPRRLFFLGPPLLASDCLRVSRAFLWLSLDLGRRISLYSRKPQIQLELGPDCFFSKSSSMALMKESFQSNHGVHFTCEYHRQKLRDKRGLASISGSQKRVHIQPLILKYQALQASK